MNDILKYIQEGNLLAAYLIIIGTLGLPFILKKLEKVNPRSEYLPYWIAGFMAIIVALHTMNLISLTQAWIGIAGVLVFFAYLYLINRTIKASYENILLKCVRKILKKKDIKDYKAFYKIYRFFFVTTLGKYYFSLSFLYYVSEFGISSLTFEMLSDIEKLTLTDTERVSFYLLEFEIYSKAGAIRLWQEKYDLEKLKISEKSKLSILSIIQIESLELEEAEATLRKLLAKSTNDKVIKQIAENNLAALAEKSGKEMEWADYAQRAQFAESGGSTVKSISNYNLILNYVHTNQTEKALKEFNKYIKYFPSATVEQRLSIENEKLRFFSQIGDKREINDSIHRIYWEYMTTIDNRRYNILISLLRISFNYDVRFEEVLADIEMELENILEMDFHVVARLFKETLALAQSLRNTHITRRIDNILIKSANRLNAFDFDKEISKIRTEEVLKIREYIVLRSRLVDYKYEYIKKDLGNSNTLKNTIVEKLKHINYIIEFDIKNSTPIYQLNSLFLKLDQITAAVRLSKQNLLDTDFVNGLTSEVPELLSSINDIMSKAKHAKNMSEYHLQLAHHYCLLGNDELGFKHFQFFEQSNVNVANFANWLKNIYYNLDKYFKEKGMR